MDETTRLRALLEQTERERADIAATLETRNAEHALAMERVAELEAIIAGRFPHVFTDETAAHPAVSIAEVSRG